MIGVIKHSLRGLLNCKSQGLGTSVYGFSYQIVPLQLTGFLSVLLPSSKQSAKSKTLFIKIENKPTK